MFLFPLQIPLANIQTSKSSLLAHCHIPISQPNTQAFSVTKMKDFIFFFPRHCIIISWNWNMKQQRSQITDKHTPSYKPLWESNGISLILLFLHKAVCFWTCSYVHFHSKKAWQKIALNWSRSPVFMIYTTLRKKSCSEGCLWPLYTLGW